ncbi:M23 family metallopeptidase [Agromyces ramosus]|uniref:Murein DD-endopeptidase MepM/ murein hydrolase activator NlpD n=1 Tax=Agromyces ramosus TaxID=33879 RepID=A0ABU0R3G8_9MICO|nr:M23 family metallopeptidase [Agromyces ramosus]MDQ0892618.1 murein DD-endopeptidase MepM/ murein hydrolase activator NlpD [Agromyces ramosus]
MTATPPNIAGPAGPAARARHRRNGAGIAAASVLVVGTFAAFASISPAAAGALALGIDEPARSSPPLEYALPWHWPVPAPIRVIEPFRAPATPYAAGHRGVDLAAEPGAAVVAPDGGVVSFAGSVAGRGVVAIDHGDGVVSAIEPVSAAVAAGTVVIAGDVIGTVSAGGHCDARCVHFGVRVHGEYVSPFLFLGGLPRAVLLPTAE